MSWTSETNIKGPAGPPGGLGEAPVDGKTYGRNNAAWNVVVSGGGTASSITVVPAGNISSTNVQAALQELDSEKIVRNPATAMPLVESGSGAVGTSLLYAREDHVHPLVGGGSTTYCQDTAPVGAPAGSTWFETDTGLFYVNYFDGDSTQFVTVISATDPSTYAVRYDMAQTLSAPQQIQARQNINADSSVRYDTAQALTSAQKTQARVNIATPLRGWLAGLTLSTAGASATFGVAAGEVADSTTSDLMQLASAVTKTTAAWTVGSGVGALDTGTIAANTWYHVYLIKRPDTGAVDVLISLSAIAPTMPANYTLFRRIGSLRTNASSQWTAFVQNGDTFEWVTTITDANGVAGSVTAASVSLTIPIGVIVEAKFSALFAIPNGGSYLYFYSLDRGVQTASTGPANTSLAAIAPNTQQGGMFQIRTNASAQIGVVANSTLGTYYVGTYGWIDRRGRDA